MPSYMFTEGSRTCPVQGCRRNFYSKKELDHHIAASKGKGHRRYRLQKNTLAEEDKEMERKRQERLEQRRKEEEEEEEDRKEEEDRVRREKEKRKHRLSHPDPPHHPDFMERKWILMEAYKYHLENFVLVCVIILNMGLHFH